MGCLAKETGSVTGRRHSTDQEETAPRVIADKNIINVTIYAILTSFIYQGRDFHARGRLFELGETPGKT